MAKILTFPAEGKTPEFYQLLKNEIKQVFGRGIATAGDCTELSNDIYEKVASRINFNTLRRFFGLVKADYNPSLITTGILCRYCGYNSPAELIAAKSLAINHLVVQESMLLKYLVNIFKSIPVIENDNETYNSLVKITIQYLNDNIEVADLFQKAIVKTENGMSFYFEQFIHIDKLHSYYGNGLSLYINEARTPERKVFGYSLLCLKYWLGDNEAALIETYLEIRALGFDKENAAVTGLYFAAALLHADVMGVYPQNIFIEAYNSHLNFKNTKFSIRESFELIYCRALLLAGHFDEALYYAEYLIENYLPHNQSEELNFHHTLLLLKGISLSKTNKLGEAAQIFNMIEASEFNFLSQKTDTVLYFDFARRINENIADGSDQTKGLIAELGFKKLRSMII